MKRLNLGCGTRIHPDWTNVDFATTRPGVLAHDLRLGIPFAEATFDVVYHSHVLEHFSKAEGKQFMAECFRVLRPGGVLRVAVPDLETICRLYLENLEGALQGSVSAAANYEWMMIELLDQTTRTTPGGCAREYLSLETIPNEEFVIQRWAAEAKRNIELARKTQHDSQLPPAGTLKKLVAPAYRFFKYAEMRRQTLNGWRDGVLKRVLGPEWPALELGRFRTGGSVHQWMYDRYSLAALMESCGFLPPVQRSAIESSVPGWAAFNLDTEPDGAVYKSDSLFMEGAKP